MHWYLSHTLGGSGGNGRGQDAACGALRNGRRRRLFLSRTLSSPLSSLQAKRRRQFENTQDKAKRKLKEVRMRRSK
jgi:hypothetical protein